MAMSKTGSTGVDDEQMKKILQEGLAGRKALWRAYETVSGRVDDTELRDMLRRFADEEREEYQVSEQIVQQHGGNPSIVSGIRDEVVNLMSRRAFSQGSGPYSSVRDLTILYGIEAAGQLGAEAVKPLAEATGDDRWKEAVNRSVERAENHMQAIRECVDSYSSKLGSGTGGLNA